MKSIVCAAALLATLFSTSVAAQQDLARRNGCLNCHAAEQSSRRMPAMSMPELARKYGELGEDKLVARLMDRSGGHPPIRSNADETRQIIRWMLTLK